ncbi:unnamed protein product, partial [Didymodactylos carnosus]
MLTVTLSVLLSLLSNTNSQIIPLRFDLAINRLLQYQHFSLANLIKDVDYNLTPEQMLEYMSLSLSNNETSPCERDFEITLQAALNRHT